MNIQINQEEQVMKAFVDTPVQYEDFLANVQLHKELDQYAQGMYWSDYEKKGCAVGCTLHTFVSKPEIAKAVNADKLDYGAHRLFEPLFGIPRIVARLQDRIFEGLPVEDAKEFPLQFAHAIKVGADYSLVWHKFAAWLLLDSEHGVIQYAKTDRTRDAIQRVGDLYNQHIGGNEPSVNEWHSAHAAAAADDAYAAAAAAYAAAAYADDAAAAADAYAADRHNHFKMRRDKLLALLAEG